jgi:hypothetical protein
MVLIYKSGLLFIGMQRIHRFVSMRRMETRLSAGMANSETLFYFYSFASKRSKGVKSAVDFYRFSVTMGIYPLQQAWGQASKISS